ncbi:MAG TPA: PAC2 family protein [Candidatus Nanoarchaeia archaeon]|nr:PAC2 family protein [Candidatus Nanoarchaeia archaeon]
MRDDYWRIEQFGKTPKLNKPIFIEGLPGIGNVGKLAVDFLIDELKAKKLFEITSYTFPHSVFVNEDNLVELPIVEVFYKQMKGKNDLLLLGGDVQPVDEISSYEFSEKVLDIVEKFNGKEVVTLGGIGLNDIPKKPKIYCTGNSKEAISRYKSDITSNELYGIVGPIIGVSGLLVGLSTRRKIGAVSLLAETYGHPMYLGIKGAKEILKVLNNHLKLKLDINKLDREIKDIENEVLKKSEQLSEVSKTIALKKLQKKLGKDIDYIG